MASESQAELIAEISRWDIPVLRRSVEACRQLARRGNGLTALEVAGTLGKDPLMALRVLCAVNRVKRSSISAEITTIDHAVMMLGVEPFLRTFSAAPTLEANGQALEKVQYQLRGVMSRARHAALQAWDWAVVRNDAKADEVYIGTLLRHTAEMFLWLRRPEEMMRVRRAVVCEGMDPVIALEQHVGVQLDAFQGLFARTIKLPEFYWDFLDDKHAGKPRLYGPILASSLASHAERGWDSPELAKDIEAVALFLHQSGEAMTSRIHRQAVSAARDADWYGVPPAAAWLPLLPGPWPLDELCKQQEQAAQQKHDTACLVPQAEAKRRAVEALHQQAESGTTLQELMRTVLHGMHEGLGLNRVVFALLSSDRTTVRAKYVLGAGLQSPLQTFEFSLADRHLFTLLMEKMQAVWLSDANRAKIGPLIPEVIRRQIGSGDFFAMSLFVQDKPIGFIYADRENGECALDARSYQDFKSLCLQAAEGLSHLTGN